MSEVESLMECCSSSAPEVSSGCCNNSGDWCAVLADCVLLFFELTLGCNKKYNCCYFNYTYYISNDYLNNIWAY